MSDPKVMSVNLVLIIGKGLFGLKQQIFYEK